MPQELFKLLGTLAAIYASLHYYIILTDLLKERLTQNIPLELVIFISFIILAVAAYLAVAFLRQIILKFIKLEPTPKLNKWGGLIFGLTRGFLLLSLILFGLVLAPLPYFKNSVQDSYSGKPLFEIAPRSYSILWNGLASKFATGEKENKVIPKI